MTEKSMPRHNGKGEHFICVEPTTTENVFTVYDITSYFPHWEGMERNRYKNQIAFTIKGTERIVYIKDWYGVLNDRQARHIAIAYINGNDNRYRLD